MPTPEVLEHAAGLTWVQRGEATVRTSHAVGDAGGLWLIDPVDDREPLARAAAIGPIRGVIQLLDRHPRACAAIAARLDVPLHRLPDTLPDTPFAVITAVDLPGWREKALWWPERRVLVVAEVLGTNAYYRLGPGPLGIHPFLRLLVPGALRHVAPDVLLVGHGDPLTGPDVPAAIRQAYGRARRDLLFAPRRIPDLLHTR
jgi:hypothetical protein